MNPYLFAFVVEPVAIVVGWVLGWFILVRRHKHQ